MHREGVVLNAEEGGSFWMPRGVTINAGFQRSAAAAVDASVDGGDAIVS